MSKFPLSTPVAPIPEQSQTAAGGASYFAPPSALEKGGVLFDDSKSLSDYVLVRKDRKQNVDVKTSLPALPRDEKSSGTNSDELTKPLLQRYPLKATLSAMTGRGGKPKLNNLRTRIWDSASPASASGTALTTVINVRPAAAAEFASFQAIYDEFKVHGCRLHFVIWSTGQTNGVVTQGNISYDPVDNAAYGGIVTSLAASQKTGPFTVWSATDASLASSSARTIAPIAVSKSGMYILSVKCPKGAQMVVNNSQQVATGLWCDTNITSSQGDYGYIKPYISAAGSTTITMTYFIEYDVEFRSRT